MTKKEIIEVIVKFFGIIIISIFLYKLVMHKITMHCNRVEAESELFLKEHEAWQRALHKEIFRETWDALDKEKEKNYDRR